MPMDSIDLSGKLRVVRRAAEHASALADVAVGVQSLGGDSELTHAARRASIHAAEAAFRATDAARGALDTRTALELARNSLTEAQGALDAAWALLDPDQPGELNL